jgi:replicative DNA helicase
MQNSEAQLPYDESAEAGVLGAMLCDEHAASLAAAELGGEDFYDARHRQIFLLFVELLPKHPDLDYICVRTEAARRGIKDNVLSDLIKRTPTAANIERYCRIVKERAAARRILASTRRIADLVRRGECYSSAELLREIDGLSREAAAPKQRAAAPVNLADLAKEVAERVIRAPARELVGLPTGVCAGAFDRLTEGIQARQFWALAAYPGYGKSTLIAAIARGCRARNKQAGCPLILTTEMSTADYCEGMLAAVSGVGAKALSKSQLQHGGREAVQKAVASGLLDGIYVMDVDGMTTSDVGQIMAQHSKAHGMPLCVIDMVSKLGYRGPVFDQFTAIGEIVKDLPGLAREHNTCLIGVAHLRKNPSGAKASHPTMNDIRDTANFAQFADRILALHRTIEESPFGGASRIITEVIQLKDRKFGDCSMLRMEWNHRTGEYAEVKKDE